MPGNPEQKMPKNIHLANALIESTI